MRCSECSVLVDPIVCLDIDGTMGHYHAHFLKFMRGYFGREMPDRWDGRSDWEDYLQLSRRDYEDAKLAFRQGGLKRTMPMVHGARELSQRCSGIAEVWVTTTRPYNRLDSVDPDTREWLRRNEIEFDHLLYDEDKYGKLAEIVDPSRVIAVVEDLPEQYDRAAEVFGPDVPILHLGLHNAWASESRTFARTLLGAADMIEERDEQWRKTHV